MSEYYTQDITQLPMPMILRGGPEGSWPGLLRLIFAVRKLLNWHYRPTYGLPIPGEYKPLEIGELPECLQDEFTSWLMEAGRLSFQKVALSRSGVIGFTARYVCFLCSHDHTTILTMSAFRSQVGKASGQTRPAAFRTDLADGRALVTGRGSPGYEGFLGPRFKAAVLPETTSLTDLHQRHLERLREFPPSTRLVLPEIDLDRFLIQRAHVDMQPLIRSGFFRRISAEDVARLRAVRFDFE